MNSKDSPLKEESRVISNSNEESWKEKTVNIQLFPIEMDESSN
jgi:hypothetical protein